MYLAFGFSVFPKSAGCSFRGGDTGDGGGGAIARCAAPSPPPPPTRFIISALPMLCNPDFLFEPLVLPKRFDIWFTRLSSCSAMGCCAVPLAFAVVTGGLVLLLVRLGASAIVWRPDRAKISYSNKIACGHDVIREGKAEKWCDMVQLLTADCSQCAFVWSFDLRLAVWSTNTRVE